MSIPLRGLMAGATVLLALTLALPLWSTYMEAPQYHDEETLEVTVYAGRVAGDLEEISTLNQYVGVHLPLDTPELQASPWVLGGLAGLALLLLLLTPLGWRRAAAAFLLIVLLATAGGGAVLLRQRLYEMGHVRDKPIFEGVPDFTPPLLGSAKIANFTVTTRLRAGAWCYIAAGLLLGWGVLVGERERGSSVP
ncbi:MAG: hypothetical protein PVJ49_13885 [Acidobacteriota bacterium]